MRVPSYGRQPRPSLKIKRPPVPLNFERRAAAGFESVRVYAFVYILHFSPPRVKRKQSEAPMTVSLAGQPVTGAGSNPAEAESPHEG